MRSPYKCLKSNLVLIKKEKKEGSKQLYMKEHHAVVCFVFPLLEPLLTIPGSDGTDPPKKGNYLHIYRINEHSMGAREPPLIW